MEGQSTEDKLNVLNTIFGNDLTQSVITNTLRDNNNQFDPSVEKLLTLPPNKVTPPPQPQQQQAPMDGKGIENIKRLHTMFGDLTQSVITTVYESNSRDVEGTVDTLLNMTSNEVASGARKEAEIARQEQELRAYEEFKQQQQKLQEQERKATETAQRAREAEQQKKKADEDAARRAEHEKKAQAEHARALQEQERLLVEFQRKRAEEQEKRNAEEKAKQLADAQKKKTELEKKIEEERMRAEKKLMEERVAAEKSLADRRAAEEKRAVEEKKAADAKRLAEENLALKKQAQTAEAERKILEARMKEEIQREEEERRKFAENERKLREEQENIKKSWEDKLRKLENERRIEEQARKEEEVKRAEAKRAEEEERARHEADMRKILELERLKLEEQRRRVEEEKKDAEERLKAMELASRKREEEEARRAREEEERKREEAERIRLLEEETQTRERLKEEMAKVMEQEKFAASAVLVPPAVDEPKVQIDAQVDGTEISGKWTLLKGVLPSSQAWLGLFPKRSINTYVGFLYVSGTSGEFHFKGLTPGHYEVRIFGSKLVTSRIAESATMLIGPQVLSFNAQMQGDQIMFEYQLDPPSVPSTWDWVGIYEKSQRRNKIYLSSTYGNTSGKITAVLPRTPGDYEARLFAAGAKYNEQAAVDFAVVDNDHISADLVDGVIKANWVIRTVEPTNSDWIGLFAAGEVSNKYLASVYTHGASAGSVDIPLPKEIPAGVYELRLFSSKVGKYATFRVSNVLTLN